MVYALNLAYFVCCASELEPFKDIGAEEVLQLLLLYFHTRRYIYILYNIYIIIYIYTCRCIYNYIYIYIYVYISDNFQLIITGTKCSR